MLRKLLAWSSVFAALVISNPSAVQAYQLNLVPVSPPSPAMIGDIIVYEIFLDTQGQSSISRFSVGLTFDPTVVEYRPDLSASNSYYPLYAPGASGKGLPLSWLLPDPFDGNHCSGLEPLCSNPPQPWTGDPPAVGGQVNVAFVTSSANSTVMTATNLLLARLAFEAVGAGPSVESFGFGHPGNEFSVNGVDITDPAYDGPGSVQAVGSLIYVVPEPTTALLLAAGLLGLGIRRRAR